jgi:small GTP-binding protein
MEQNWKPIEYKFILLGDSSVGKSAIFSRLSGKQFSGNYISTIGTEKIIIDFDNVPIDDNIILNFRILLFDTAGQERYKAITKTYFRDSQGIILIYSIVDETSFTHIQAWLDSIRESLADWRNSGYMIMLLGNKLDIAEGNNKQRMILKEEAEKICTQKGIYWGGECSAKEFGENQFKEIFTKFMIQIYLKLRKSNKYNNINNNKQISRKLSHFKKKPKEKTCCAFMKKDDL